MKTEFNSNHKRVLSSTVKIVDEELRSLKQLLEKNNSDSKINFVEKSFDNKTSKKMMLILDSLLKMNSEMYDDLGLKRQQLTERQIVSSKVSYLWTILSDSHSKRLKAFGEISEDSAKKIDKYLDKMLIEIEKILKI